MCIYRLIGVGKRVREVGDTPGRGVEIREIREIELYARVTLFSQKRGKVVALNK